MDADHNWPSEPIRRLSKTSNGFKTAVVNEGIAGNRLVDDGPLASFGRQPASAFRPDALSVPDITWRATRGDQ